MSGHDNVSQPRKRAPFTICKAGANDAHSAWAIRNSSIQRQCAGCYPLEVVDAWTSGEMPDAFVEDVERSFFVARLEGRVVGTGALDLKTGKIDAVFVHPDYMRFGIGRAIVLRLVELARDAGLASLTLEATLNATPFYRACGFSGGETATYQSPRGFAFDCVPMWLNFDPQCAKQPKAPM